MQNRRNFLKMLVGGVAVTAAAQSFPFRVFSFPAEAKPIAATIGQYADYASFSSLELAAAIDPVVAKVAAELGYRAGLSISQLVAQTYDRSPRFKFFEKTSPPQLAAC